MDVAAVSTVKRVPPTEGRVADCELIELPSPGEGSLGCWMAIPHRIDENAPSLIAVHGIHRNAYAQASGFAGVASSLGRVVIAPLFDAGQHRNYQQVLLRSRSDIALFQLLERIRRMGIPISQRFDLFGYSGGAQFAHRFAMFYPHRIARLTVAAAGWYTYPDDAPYPYGLGTRKRPHTALGRHTLGALPSFLALPIRVFAGQLDNSTDVNTRRNASIDAKQGTNRLERAKAWTRALERTAGQLGISSDVVFEEVAGCIHRFVDYMRKGRIEFVAFSPSAGTGRP